MSARGSKTPPKKSGWTDAAESAEVMPELFFEGEALDDMTTFKLEALTALHERKVGGLMKSIGTLRDEVARLKAESKEHRRSQLIQSLREKLREQELAVDVLKEALVEGQRGALTEEQVNELVILRTLGGPKRFRPKSREELQNELAAATRRNEVLAKRARALGETDEDKTTFYAAPKKKIEEQESTPKLLRDDGDGLPSASHLREVSELLKKLEEAQVSISRYELQLADGERAADRLRDEKQAAERELGRYDEKKAEAAEVRDLLEQCRQERDRAEVALARKDGEIETLRLQLDHLRATNAAEAEALKHDLGVARDELSRALANEDEMRTAVVLERERAGLAIKGEVAAKASADGRVATAERALRDAVKERERLQERYDEREAVLREERALAFKASRRDSKRFEADSKRRLQEERRLVQIERDRIAAAENEARVADARAEALREQVDALQAELRAVGDARADDQSEFDTERLRLTERIGALEATVEQERACRDVDADGTEARVDRIAAQTSRERARADRFEELHAREHARRERAEAGEADYAATTALSRKRQSDLRDANATLQRRVTQLRVELDASVERARLADDAKRRAEKVLENDRRVPRGDDEENSEIEATREALVAHMRLAAIYARVQEAGGALNKVDAQKAHQDLKKARAQLGHALASSAKVEKFYVEMLGRIEGRRPPSASSQDHHHHRVVSRETRARDAPEPLADETTDDLARGDDHQARRRRPESLDLPIEVPFGFEPPSFGARRPCDMTLARRDHDDDR